MNLNGQYFTFSDYKNHNTAKFLLGISPGGFLTYVSGAYPGRISDNDIVEACDFLDGLTPGDYVMADKGFLIRGLLNRRGCNLIIPPKKHANMPFTEMDAHNTSKVANLRIHVERMVRLIKMFQFLIYRDVPVAMIDPLTKIFTVCALI
jgi:hypothetical protein